MKVGGVIIRKVFLDCLPRKVKHIDWKNSVGYDVYFVYDDVVGYIKIISHYVIRKNSKSRGFLKIEYQNIISDICIENFSDARLSSIIGKCARKLIEGINDIPITDPWMVKYFQGGIDEAKLYSRGSHKKFFPICPDCGSIKELEISPYTLYRTKSIGCVCSDGRSYPEKFVMSVLKQLNVKYNFEYKADWLKGYKGSNKSARLDYYLPNNNLVIEVDGGFHKKPHAQSRLTVKEVSKKDEWKDKQIRDNGLNVIRVPADESTYKYMKDSVIERLGDIFDLTNIDWRKCEEQAMKNVIKEVCIYYESNKHLKRLEIANMFNICVNTLREYLKRGSVTDWCSYNVVDSINSNRERFVADNKRRSKSVDVYKDDVFLKSYISTAELVNKCLVDFGVQFHQANISSVVCGKRRQHKGYTFKLKHAN